MGQDYVEGILVWAENGPSAEVGKWLADRGLQVVPMCKGLLISGDRERFNAAFRVELDSQVLPATIPIPTDWRDIVSSITVPRPPDYHSHDRR